MSIDFTCPATSKASNFPDAYAGVKYRCKHCAEFHTLPHPENYVHKDILTACPKTDEVVSIDSSIKTNRFQCASCGEIHEVPGETNLNTTEIASSSKYQNQSRLKIIPSVRKKSLLLAESETKMKAVSQTDIKAISQADIKAISQTDLKAVPQSDRKQVNQTDRKKVNNSPTKSQESKKESADRARKINKQPKSRISISNIIIILILFGVAFGIWYFATRSNESSTIISELNAQFLIAERENELGNFDKAIGSTEQILNTIAHKPELRLKINYNEIDSRNKLYKKQKEVCLSIEKDFNTDLTNPNLSRSGIEKALARLVEVPDKLPVDLKNSKPILKSVNKIKTAFYKKYTLLFNQEIDNKFTKSEEIFLAGNYQESIFRVNEIIKLIDSQDKENQESLKTTFNKRLKYFEEIQKKYSDINTIYAKGITTPLLINEVELELKTLASNLGSKENTLKVLIDQKLILLSEQKKILEVRKLDNQLKDKAEVKKDLIAYLNRLTPIEFSVKQETIKHISRVSAQISEIPEFQQVSLEKLTLIAKAIGETLNEKDDVLKVSIDTDKSKISLKEENISYIAGYYELASKSYFMLIINGIKILFEKDLFEKDMNYFTKQAKYMHDALLIYAGDMAFSQEPWVISEELMRIGAPAALKTNDKGVVLFLIDQIYKIPSLKPFISNELIIRQSLQTQIEKTKRTVITSNETLDTKSNLIFLLDKICPNENTKLINFAPYKNWLINNDYQSILTDANCIKAFTELKTVWMQTFEKQTPWIEGESDNKITIQLYRINGNRIGGKIYNTEKVETTFLSTTAEAYDFICDDISLQYSFLSVYQGNHPTEPNTAPLRVFTVHPAGGIICINDNLANKFESNDKVWNKAFEQSKLFGKNGSTKSGLLPHVLRLNNLGAIQEIYSNNYRFNIEKIQSGPDEVFDKWFKENKKNISSLEEINLLLLYCIEHSKDYNQSLDLPLMSNKSEKSFTTLKNGKFIGKVGAIPLFISSIVSNIGRPNVIMYIDNEMRNLWLENQLEKQFLCFLNRGFINRVNCEEFLRDIKFCFQNKSNQFYNPYKIPVAVYESKLKTWSFFNIPGLLISDLFSEENRLEALEKFTSGSQTSYIDLLNNAIAKTLKESDTLLYITWESQSAFKLAFEAFSKGIKATKKENTLSAKIEQIRLMKYTNKEKEIETALADIFQNIVSSDALKAEPDKLIDIRLYLAKEFAEYGKINSAFALLNPNKSTNLLTQEILQVYADICYISYNLVDKSKLTATEYKTEIEPCQPLIESSFQALFNQSAIELKSLLLLNLAWVKVQSIKGIDNTNQQLLSPSQMETKLLPFSGKELIAQQWEWAKLNPLCYELMIQRFINDIEPEKELDVKQKVNIAFKLIKSMTGNLLTENPTWKNHPQQPVIDSLMMFADLSESKWNLAVEKIMKIINSNKPEYSFYRYLSIITINMSQTDMNNFINECIKVDLPDQFYRKYYYELIALKVNKKSKILGGLLKDKLPEHTDLILDTNKE